MLQALNLPDKYRLKPASPMALPAVLPDDVNRLKALLHTLHETHVRTLERTQQQANANIVRMYEEMFEQMVLMRQRLFGRSSEQHAGQARLFDEAELLAAQPEVPESEAPEVAVPDTAPSDAPSATPKKARGCRAPLPAELPRVDIVHEVPEAERLCPCGTPMVEIGQEISEQLDIVPMKVQVLRHIRKRYGCPDQAHAPVTALLPAQPLPKSNASPNLLAMLLTVKYADGLPLARFEKVLDRHGAHIPRQTLARWTIGTGKLFQPLHNLARDTLYDGAFVHIDETEVQVLKEAGREASAKSYMWVQAGGPPDRPVILYDYEARRNSEVPLRLLADYRGYVMSDGYKGYNELAGKPGIEHLVCMAHARRHFVDAARVQAKGKRGRADEAIELIKGLYQIEREIQGLSDEDRHSVRQDRSKAQLDMLKAWLDKALPAVPPHNALGQALQYLAKYWPKLIRYIERGDLPIDNNRVERAIRPFVIGRRSWLFSDTPAGAHASAVIYSMIETAKANGVEPYLWLSNVIRELPAAKTADDYEALMPWNLNLKR